MNCTRTVNANAFLTKQSAAQALKALNNGSTTLSRPAFTVLQHQHLSSRRQFSTTNKSSFSKSNNWLMKEFFPTQESPHINRTPPAWPHPVYTQEQMDAVIVAHREAKTWSDKVAMMMVRILRWGLDLATGYKHAKAAKLSVHDPEGARKKYAMTERKYMIRNIFLESVAGMFSPLTNHPRSDQSAY